MQGDSIGRAGVARDEDVIIQMNGVAHIRLDATFRRQSRRNDRIDAALGSRTFPGFAENIREGGGPQAENLPAGLILPAGGVALALSRYLAKYNVDREKLAAIVLAQRHNAMLNPMAAMRKPITVEDYRASPDIVAPLRLLDYSAPVDVGVAVIMARADRAADLTQKPILLHTDQGVAAGPDEFVFGQRGLGINQCEETDWRPLGAAEPVFADAGITPHDVDTLHCYDAFTSAAEALRPSMRRPPILLSRARCDATRTS